MKSVICLLSQVVLQQTIVWVRCVSELCQWVRCVSELCDCVVSLSCVSGLCYCAVCMSALCYCAACMSSSWAVWVYCKCVVPVISIKALYQFGVCVQSVCKCDVSIRREVSRARSWGVCADSGRKCANNGQGGNWQVGGVRVRVARLRPRARAREKGGRSKHTVRTDRVLVSRQRWNH